MYGELSDGYIALTFDQSSAIEKEGDLPQAREIAYCQVNSKTVQLTTIKVTGDSFIIHKIEYY